MPETDTIDSVINDLSALVSSLRAALKWIDAVPKDTVALLPAMPGFNRDYVEKALERAYRHVPLSAHHEHEKRISFDIGGRKIDGGTAQPATDSAKRLA